MNNEDTKNIRTSFGFTENEAKTKKPSELIENGLIAGFKDIVERIKVDNLDGYQLDNLVLEKHKGNECVPGEGTDTIYIIRVKLVNKPERL